MKDTLDTQQTIERLESEFLVFSDTRKELEQLKKEQSDTIMKTIDKIKPLAEWYLSKNLIFTHPRLKYRSSSGPIVGHDPEENELYILNINKGYVEKVNLYNSDERSNQPVWKLVDKGYFIDAMAGLLYLEDEMINNYIHRNKEGIANLTAQLKEYK